jgi:L-lysine exporter family protein LysE/ArgO
MLFLTVYGWQAFQRFLHPKALVLNQPQASNAEVGAPAGRVQAAPLTRRQAFLSALAFSWLNPHAWLDTAVLIGTASLAYGQGSTSFGLGAAAGSLLWFLILGVAAFWLGRRLNSLHVWRALDAGVALMMWGTVVWLALGLVS